MADPPHRLPAHLRAARAARQRRVQAHRQPVGCVRFSYAEAMVDPAFYLPLAQAAEEAGYHSMTVADSICYPAESDSTYPYTPDGSREFLENKPFIEPFSLI